ncbi:TPA: helix-turn-helix transcriptional regulator [Morganella morganii subsp. morganii]|nr:helix-turn-helix transcriptional regulator [Morganella morganii subsp. morganii]
MEKTDILRFVGSRIREIRCLNCMTTKDLSTLIGISQQQLSRYECGVNNISANIIYRLVVVLKCDVDYFFPDKGKYQELTFDNYGSDYFSIFDGRG